LIDRDKFKEIFRSHWESFTKTYSRYQAARYEEAVQKMNQAQGAQRKRLNEKEKFMKIQIVYKEENGWFVGHLQQYPDYESQGKTLGELRENLIEIYDDISKGLVPNAKFFQVLEVAI